MSKLINVSSPFPARLFVNTEASLCSLTLVTNTEQTILRSILYVCLIPYVDKFLTLKHLKLLTNLCFKVFVLV